MPTYENCPFCLSNNLLGTEVLADTLGGFLTTAQGSDGSYLIIPKAHCEHPAALPENWWRDASELLAQIPDLGDHYNIALNVGKHAGQSVKHLHFWVIRRSGDQPASGKGLARLISEQNQE